MKKMLIVVIVILLCSNVLGNNILEISLKIMKDESVTADAKVSFGSSSAYMNESGDYRLAILDPAGTEIWGKSYGLKFRILTNPVRENELELITEKIDYKEDMYELRLYHGSEEVLRRYLDFCDSNGICDQNENHLSCPGDCPNSIRDGICISATDGNCDPDCIYGTDIDCREEEKAKKRAYYLLFTIFCLLAATILVSFHEKGKLLALLNSISSRINSLIKKISKQRKL